MPRKVKTKVTRTKRVTRGKAIRKTKRTKKSHVNSRNRRTKRNKRVHRGGSTSKLSVKNQLWNAARKGEVEELKRLHKAGTLVNEIDEFGNTALHKAASNGRLEAVKYLLQAGADPDIQNDDKDTALHTACRCYQGTKDNCPQKTSIIQALVQGNATKNIKNNLGRTPFEDSCSAKPPRQTPAQAQYLA